jgi:hypothetical protein
MAALKALSCFEVPLLAREVEPEKNKRAFLGLPNEWAIFLIHLAMKKSEQEPYTS